MIRAKSISDGAVQPLAATDTITLTYDDRQRRRIALTSDHGTEFLLDLPKTASLRDGHALALEDGRYVVVKAAEEHLLRIRAANSHHLARVAWHLGNRHLATQIEPDHILIRYDHVILNLVAGLGATVEEVESAFEPESGAYAHAH